MISYNWRTDIVDQYEFNTDNDELLYEMGNVIAKQEAMNVLADCISEQGWELKITDDNYLVFNLNVVEGEVMELQISKREFEDFENEYDLADSLIDYIGDEIDEINDDLSINLDANVLRSDFETKLEDKAFYESSNIIGLYSINKYSTLYQLLEKWYEKQDKKMENEIRDFYEDSNNIYFVTGCGYSIFDADLFGGNADGRTVKKFEQFMYEELANDSTRNASFGMSLKEKLDMLDRHIKTLDLGNEVEVNIKKKEEER